MSSINLLKEAWHLVKGFKGVFWLAIFYALSFFMLLVVVTLPIHLLGSAIDLLYPTYFLMAILIGYFILPVGLRIFILALHHADARPIKPIKIFSYYQLSIMGQIFLLTLLFIILIGLLFMVPSWIFRGILVFGLIYFITIWILTNMLLAEQHRTLLPAVKKATQVVLKHPLKIFTLFVVIGVLGMVSFFTLFIGLIWIAPFIINIFAVLYRNYFK